MARIVNSPEAELDTVQIWRYIAQDNPAAADRFMDRIDQKLKLLAESPGIGPLRDELVAGLRSFPVGRYILFYRSIPDGIELVRVLHGARDLRRLFKR